MESTTTPKTDLEIFQANNKMLMNNLIPKGYRKLETTKVYDEAFNLPCQLPSIKIEKLLQ